MQPSKFCETRSKQEKSRLGLMQETSTPVEKRWTLPWGSNRLLGWLTRPCNWLVQASQWYVTWAWETPTGRTGQGEQTIWKSLSMISKGFDLNCELSRYWLPEVLFTENPCTIRVPVHLEALRWGNAFNVLVVFLGWLMGRSYLSPKFKPESSPFNFPSYEIAI